MGFEPDQPQSHVESINEFKEQMEDVLKEAKAALVKSKEDMVKYYNWKRIPALDYQPGDKVYLDTSNIQMTRPSQKLSHQRLGPFPIVVRGHPLKLIPITKSDAPAPAFYIPPHHRRIQEESW